MKLLLKIGNAIFNVLMLFWLYFAIYFTFQYFNIDYTNLESSEAKLLLLIPVLLVLIFYFREKTKQILKYCYQLLIKYKLSVTIALVIFQLIVTFTSLGLASADTTIVYNIATNSDFALQTDYLSYYPNNFLLVIWMKFNNIIFAENTVFALAIWNIIFIDLSIWTIYIVVKEKVNQRVGDITFILSSFILGLSPQYIYVYSDPITLFLLSLLILVVIKTIDGEDKNQSYFAILSGVVLAITYGFRPTVMIFVIAAAIVYIARVFSLSKEKLKRSIILIALALLSFGIVNRGLAYSMKHQSFVRYESGYSRTLAYYVDLGLTYSGNVHAEIPQQVAEATGEARNITAKKDISKRLKQYNLTTFTGHMYYKYYWMVGEGMFGWLQERVLSEETRLNVPWLKRIQDTAFSKWVRSYVYVEGANYRFYGFFIQIIWIVLSLGLFLFYRHYSNVQWFQLWMQISLFGGLLFLLIFEAGRSRYLIQFLPAIITVSAIGLSGNLVNEGKKNEK